MPARARARRRHGDGSSNGGVAGRGKQGQDEDRRLSVSRIPSSKQVLVLCSVESNWIDS
jgi:ribosomal protein L15